MRDFANEFREGPAKLFVERVRKRDVRLAVKARDIDPQGGNSAQKWVHPRAEAGSTQHLDLGQKLGKGKTLAGPGFPEKSDRQRRFGIAVDRKLGQRPQRPLEAQGIRTARQVGGKDTAALAGLGLRSKGRKARSDQPVFFCKIARCDIGHVAVPFEKIQLVLPLQIYASTFRSSIRL